MTLFRFLEPFSRDACLETGVLPQRSSREKELLAQPLALTRVENRHEKSDTNLRRREKYLAAVRLAAAISAALSQTAWAGGISGNADHGEALYEACQDCPSFGQNHVGARQPIAFRSKAASLQDYDYSDALKSANIPCNEETLDKWLTDPQAVAHGAKMFLRSEDSQDRANVIAYLKERAE
jgi:cytochrome c